MNTNEQFMGMHYRVSLQYDPEGFWIADHPELPGCRADGETAEEALASLETVPITRSPNSLAHCTAIRPTSPAAACSRIVSPAFSQGLVFNSQ